MTEVQGKLILVQVSVRFELARVLVIGSRLYYELLSHVLYQSTLYFWLARKTKTNKLSTGCKMSWREWQLKKAMKLGIQFLFLSRLCCSVVLPTTPPCYAGYFFRKLNNLFWEFAVTLSRALKRLKFQLVLWASSSHILLAQAELSLRTGGCGFPPAIMNMAPSYFHRKIEEK